MQKTFSNAKIRFRFKFKNCILSLQKKGKRPATVFTVLLPWTAKFLTLQIFNDLVGNTTMY